jgi:Zn finger protein HypA/HybF involved in hydrogenase expression
MSQKSIYTKEYLEGAVSESSSVSDTLRRLGKKVTGSAHRYLSKKIKELNLDTSHFTGNSGQAHKGGVARKHWSYYLVLNGTHCKQAVKKAFLESGAKEQCAVCGLSAWLNKPIVVQLDHINGDSFDHRKENLRLLCPNCHSQTNNFSGRNSKRQKKALPKCDVCGVDISRKAKNCHEHRQGQRPNKIDWPSLDWLLQRLETTPCYKLAKELGVSDVAVQKHVVGQQKRIKLV